MIEIAWLIERGSPPEYWLGRQRDVSSWTSHAGMAVRFSRGEDAHRLITYMDMSNEPTNRNGYPKAVEHMWMDGPPPAVSAPDARLSAPAGMTEDKWDLQQYRKLMADHECCEKAMRCEAAELLAQRRGERIASLTSDKFISDVMTATGFERTADNYVRLRKAIDAALHG